MQHGAPMDTTDTRPVNRRMERWLVGMAMILIAFLIEKAMLRSIKRSGAKSS